MPSFKLCRYAPTDDSAWKGSYESSAQGFSFLHRRLIAHRVRETVGFRTYHLPMFLRILAPKISSLTGHAVAI